MAERKTEHLHVRISPGLGDELRKRARRNDLGPVVRQLLAEALGKPALAAVKPRGRPPGYSPKKR